MDVEHFIIVFFSDMEESSELQRRRGGVMVDFDTHTSGQRRLMPDYGPATGDGPGSEL